MAFRYRAFVPDPIAEASFSFAGDVAEAIGRAERAVAELNRNPPSMGSLEVLARRLLRSESVASSRIEGLDLSQRRLARAEVIDGEARDETARSVLANVAAMGQAIAVAEKRNALEVNDIAVIHATLMRGLDSAGEVRTQQNWIGGNPYNPHDAAFVPPPADEVSRLLADLAKFANRVDLPAVAQAAITHAQFETIHPYADGNGRVGRALVHVVLRRRQLATTYVPPVSLVLAGNSRTYIDGLTAFRDGRVDGWCRLFAQATETAAAKSVELARRFWDLQRDWLERAGSPRADSSAAALIAVLPAYPIVNLATAQEVTGRSKQAANEALAVLEAAGVLQLSSTAKRNRSWEAREVFDLLNDFERELATPLGATRPQRAAPRPDTRTQEATKERRRGPDRGR
jgi:Fic family protein